jgi:hypothetical protein
LKANLSHGISLVSAMLPGYRQATGIRIPTSCIPDELRARGSRFRVTLVAGGMVEVSPSEAGRDGGSI